MKVDQIFGNLGMKVVALALAALIWIVVSAQRREDLGEASLDVPLALVAVPRELIITSSSVQETINVRLRGPLSVLLSLSSQNLRATVDLSELRPGEFSIAIRPQSLSVPSGIEVLSIDPPRIVLKLEARRQKHVAIRPYIVGKLPPGYEEGEINLRPEVALISGPASIVGDVTEIATDRIILSGRVASFSVTSGIVSDHPLIRVIEPAATQVSVQILNQSEAAATTSTADAGSETIRTPARRARRE